MTDVTFYSNLSHVCPLQNIMTQRRCPCRR